MYYFSRFSLGRFSICTELINIYTEAEERVTCSKGRDIARDVFPREVIALARE